MAIKKPRVGTRYYYIFNKRIICYDYWSDNVIDNFRLEDNNVYFDEDKCYEVLMNNESKRNNRKSNAKRRSDTKTTCR